MKKRTIIALIVAVCLLFVGGVLVVLGLSYAGNHVPESKLTRREVTIQEPFDRIDVNTDTCDVNFAMFSGRDDCMVELWIDENVRHNVTVEDGTLKINMTDEHKWTDLVGIFNLYGSTESMKMTVYLPAAEYASLQARTATGDITLGQYPVFLEAILRSDTGDISCVTGAAGNLLDCMTSTGDITVQNSVPNVLKLQSDTGDLKLSAVAADEIHLKTNTGDVDIENCDAARVNMETDTGDVKGHFLTPKRFSASSDTGNVKVPNTPEGGECRIRSNTGDIHFE